MRLARLPLSANAGQSSTGIPVLGALVDELLEHLLFLTRINARDLQGAGQPVDAGGENIELARLVLIFGVVWHRHAFVVAGGREHRVGIRKEIGQTERIVLLVENEVRRAGRVPAHAFRGLVPDLVHHRLLIEVGRTIRARKLARTLGSVAEVDGAALRFPKRAISSARVM